MTIYFTSDTHFGSQRTLELSKRPFNCIDEMDNSIINNWNNIVKEDDIVYHLGDFGNYDVSNKLNGKIYLLLGNYEIKDINDSKITIEQLHSSNFNFYCIFLNPFELCLNENLNVYCCHEPEFYLKNHFNLFGHIHQLQMVKKFGLNVGTDCHKFKPIDIDTILFYKNAIEKFYDHNVFMYE